MDVKYNIFFVALMMSSFCFASQGKSTDEKKSTLLSHILRQNRDLGADNALLLQQVAMLSARVQELEADKRDLMQRNIDLRLQLLTHRAGKSEAAKEE